MAASAQAFTLRGPLVRILPTLSHLQEVIAPTTDGHVSLRGDEPRGIQDIELIGRKSFHDGVMEFALHGWGGLGVGQLNQDRAVFPCLVTDPARVNQHPSGPTGQHTDGRDACIADPVDGDPGHWPPCRRWHASGPHHAPKPYVRC